MILGLFAQRKTDPMLHLADYLTAAELEAAQALPPHSAKLADFVISCLDEDGACDDALRQKVYNLFSVRPSH